jgi:large conductance mechanosensitive channel
MLKEFRDSLLRGNLVTLAVAFVMGVAFAAVVTSFVNDLVMPVIAMIFGNRISATSRSRSTTPSSATALS